MNGNSAECHQLALDLEADIHEAVRQARAHRRAAEVPESLTSVEMLVTVAGVLWRRGVSTRPSAD